MTSFSGGVPLVLVFAERNHSDWPAERPVPVGLGILKGDSNWVRMAVVFIDEHKRPLAVGTLQSVGSYEQVPGGILHAAEGHVEFGRSAFGFGPLAGDELCGEEWG